MDTVFTPAAIIALSFIALINIGLLIIAVLASREESKEEEPVVNEQPTGLRVPPRSYIHWSEHPPLEHEQKLRVTPPAGII